MSHRPSPAAFPTCAPADLHTRRLAEAAGINRFPAARGLTMVRGPRGPSAMLATPTGDDGTVARRREASGAFMRGKANWDCGVDDGVG